MLHVYTQRHSTHLTGMSSAVIPKHRPRQHATCGIPAECSPGSGTRPTWFKESSSLAPKVLVCWLLFTLKCLVFYEWEQRQMQCSCRLRADEEGETLTVFHKYDYEKNSMKTEQTATQMLFLLLLTGCSETHRPLTCSVFSLVLWGAFQRPLFRRNLSVS